MTHAEHDLDLIAAHASEHVADREQAETLVRTCPECAVEYQQQIDVKQLLASVPAAQLTSSEAEALHRGVIGQLPSPVVDLNTARARKPLSPIWGRLTAVAAVLAGVVVIGTVFATGGGDSAATTTTGFELAAGESSQDRLAAAATTAASETTFEGAGGQNLEDAAILAGSDEDSLDSLAAKAQILLEQERDEAAPPATTSAGNLAYESSCPALSELTVVTTAEASLNERPVIILVVEDETDREARAFYTDDCSEIDLP